MKCLPNRQPFGGLKRIRSARGSVLHGPVMRDDEVRHGRAASGLVSRRAWPHPRGGRRSEDGRPPAQLRHLQWRAGCGRSQQLGPMRVVGLSSPWPELVSLGVFSGTQPQRSSDTGPRRLGICGTARRQSGRSSACPSRVRLMPRAGRFSPPRRWLQSVGSLEFVKGGPLVPFAVACRFVVRTPAVQFSRPHAPFQLFLGLRFSSRVWTGRGGSFAAQRSPLTIGSIDSVRGWSILGG
jgi:hypothetical protein